MLPIKWIWQHERYGEFPYDLSRVSDALQKIEYTKGKLDLLFSFLDQDTIDNIEVSNITKEIIDSSKIEGEYLYRDSVRDSVAKAVSANIRDIKHDHSTRQTDALVDLAIDSRLNQSKLNVERLHSWHNALFAHGRGDGLGHINIAEFRSYDDMRVKAGAIGKEVTKYLAPPREQMLLQIDALLNYCNESKENPYIKSALAHLWFVSIHPYDDGNGRISRAMADHILSINSQEQYKSYSISSAIISKREGYYDMLDNTTNLHKNRDFNFTHWINWHTNMLQEAMEKSIETIEFVVVKSKFWDEHRVDGLNQRQIGVLEHMLTATNHKNLLNTKLYMELTGKPKTTAINDMRKLEQTGCIYKIDGLKGRNTAYRLSLKASSQQSLKQRYGSRRSIIG